MRWNPAAPATSQYATDINWALAPKNDMKRIFYLFPDTNTTFDIPVYKDASL